MKSDTEEGIFHSFVSLVTNFVDVSVSSKYTRTLCNISRADTIYTPSVECARNSATLLLNHLHKINELAILNQKPFSKNGNRKSFYKASAAMLHISALCMLVACA